MSREVAVNDPRARHQVHVNVGATYVYPSSPRHHCWLLGLADAVYTMDSAERRGICMEQPTGMYRAHSVHRAGHIQKLCGMF